MAKTVADVMKMVEENEVQFVDLRFTDTRGKEQHVTVPVSHFDEDKFSSGHAFDGSSVAGWKGIEASDMQLMPDPARPTSTRSSRNHAVSAPRRGGAGDGKAYDRDPRSIAKRAEAYLKASGLGDTGLLRPPEPEFFIFDGVRWSNEPGKVFFEIEEYEAPGTAAPSSKSGNRGHRPTTKGGYFPVPPVDSTQDMRAEMVLILEQLGIPVEVFHHEVAGAGQNEIGTRFSTLVERADWTQVLKYVVWNVANAYGKTATFMPKPHAGDNGSGMHVHQSIWKDGKTCSRVTATPACRILRCTTSAASSTTPALNAITNPGTNSYKRLVPGYEAPVKLAYSSRNRSASIRIPYVANPKGRRIEARFPDPLANPICASRH